MKRKTLLFFSLLLVALSAGAQATVIWKASQTGSAGSGYTETVYSYAKNSTESEQSAFTTDNSGNLCYNTRNGDFYMYIAPSVFSSIKENDKIKVNLTYTSDNWLVFKKPVSGTTPEKCAEYTYASENTYDRKNPSLGWYNLTVTSDMAKDLKTNGLYIGGVYFNWNEVQIEPYVPEKPVTISQDVTNLVNSEVSVDNRRYFQEVGRRMSDAGRAHTDFNKDNGNVEYTNCYIEKGTEITIPASELSGVQPGDILRVYVENPAKLETLSEPLYDDKADIEVTNGEVGAWAGLCVNNGWLAPKYHCFPIKGHFKQVLDKHMADLIKEKGLTIKGCKFQLDYIVIEKGATRTATPYELVPTIISKQQYTPGKDNGWNDESAKIKLSDDIIAKIVTGAEFRLTYSCTDSRQIQIQFGDKAFGAIQPNKGGAYTDIAANTNGTVTFNVTGDMYNQIIDKGNHELWIRSNGEVTISKIELLTIKRGTREVVELTANGDKWEWSVKDLLNDKGLYWGNILYVESTAKPKVSLTDADGKKINGSFINTNGGHDNSYFIYLDYKDSQALSTLATTEGNNSMLQITAEGGEISTVKILPERRIRNTRDIEVNGDVDWSTGKRVYTFIGQVEQGDEITVETSTEDYENSQIQVSIMHMNEKNTKGLAFNRVFKFAERYDVLTYGRDSKPENQCEERVMERIDKPASTLSFTVESQYMAEQLYDNPFTIAGQELNVKKVSVKGKAFVYPEQIGLAGKKVLWGTMCSPYNISMPSDRVRAYVVEGYETTMNESHVYPLTLKRVYNIPAGTPVLLYKDDTYYTEEKIDDFNFEIADDKESFKGDEINNNLLCGEIMDKQLKNDNQYTYYKLSHKKDNFGQEITAFFKLADNSVFKTSADRAYLRIRKENAMNAKAFVFKFEDNGNETTGINGVETEEKTSGEKIYYNLNGQRIATPTKSGIYICNDKKVIIK